MDVEAESFIYICNLHTHNKQIIPSQPKYPAPYPYLDCASCYHNFRIDTMQTVHTDDNAENFDGKYWEEYKHYYCWVPKIH